MTSTLATDRWRPLGPLLPSRPDELVEARARVLRQSRWYPAPPHEARTAHDTTEIDMDVLRDDLQRFGVAVVNVAGPVDNAAFIAFAEQLGQPEPERDPAVQPYVTDRVILDMRPVTDGSDRNLEPFSPQPLTLHVEGTRRTADSQYRYLVFEYREMPSRDTGGQTLLLPMERLVERLGSALDPGRHLALHNPAAGPIVSEQRGHTLVYYRDPDTDPVNGYTDADGFDGTDAAEFLQVLTRSLYEPADICGLHPRANQLVVLDNTRFLHGRSGQAAPAASRRLRRIRVLNRQPATAHD
jgi:alpha-ketoglutarate-dependent taurine dioxygenase